MAEILLKRDVKIASQASIFFMLLSVIIILKTGFTVINMGSKQWSRDAVDTASTTDGGIEQAGLAVPRYVIPQKRSTLNPLATPFTTRLTAPGTLRPRVLPSRSRGKPV